MDGSVEGCAGRSVDALVCADAAEGANTPTEKINPVAQQINIDALRLKIAAQ